MSRAAVEHLLDNENWSQMVRIARGMVETYSNKPCLKDDHLQKEKEHSKEKKRIQVSQGNEFYFK